MGFISLSFYLAAVLVQGAAVTHRGMLVCCLCVCVCVCVCVCRRKYLCVSGCVNKTMKPDTSLQILLGKPPDATHTSGQSRHTKVLCPAFVCSLADDK